MDCNYRIRTNNIPEFTSNLRRFWTAFAARSLISTSGLYRCLCWYDCKVIARTTSGIAYLLSTLFDYCFSFYGIMVLTRSQARKEQPSQPITQAPVYRSFSGQNPMLPVGNQNQQFIFRVGNIVYYKPHHRIN